MLLHTKKKQNMSPCKRETKNGTNTHHTTSPHSSSSERVKQVCRKVCVRNEKAGVSSVSRGAALLSPSCPDLRRVVLGGGGSNCADGPQACTIPLACAGLGRSQPNFVGQDVIQA